MGDKDFAALLHISWVPTDKHSGQLKHGAHPYSNFICNTKKNCEKIRSYIDRKEHTFTYIIHLKNNINQIPRFVIS